MGWMGSSRLNASKSYTMQVRQQMLPFDGNSTIDYRGLKEIFTNFFFVGLASFVVWRCPPYEVEPHLERKAMPLPPQLGQSRNKSALF